MSEQAYFEQFSGHRLTDNAWWDMWAITHGGFVHREYPTEAEANAELDRLRRDYPQFKTEIVYIEKAGHGDMRMKSLGLPIWPIGVYGG